MFVNTKGNVWENNRPRHSEERGQGAEGDLANTVTPVPAAASSRPSVCSLATTSLAPMVQSSYPHMIRSKPLILPFNTVGSWRSQHLYKPPCVESEASYTRSSSLPGSSAALPPSARNTVCSSESGQRPEATVVLLRNRS